MIENVNTKKAAIKKSNGCLTAVIIAILLALGFMLYAMIDFRNMVNKTWKSFDDERITQVEKYFDMTMPDDVTPVKFNRQSAPGDGSSLCRLIVEGIDDPQEFLDKAFPDIGITEYTPDEEDSSNDNEKKNELQKFSPDSEDFSTIKDRLNSNSALKRSGYTLEFTEIYFFIDDEFSSDIGFGKTDSGYCAVISHISD